MATIIFNGKTYNSLEEMPANERQAFEQLSTMFVDKNGNGIPDFLEGDLAQNVMTAFTSTVNINGRTYNGLNELPADVRDKVQGAFEKLSELGIVTKNSQMMAQVNSTQTGRETQVPSKPFVSREYNPAIQEEGNTNRMVWVMVGLGLILCLAITALGIFFLMQT